MRSEFLYLVLERFGFDDKVVGCLKSIYHLPTERIKINGNLSGVITLERVCLQGCPSSPTLFTLCTEPLAQVIPEHAGITGISIKGREHKICLYADDVLVTLSETDLSLPNVLLMSSLEQYGLYSGNKLNIHKIQTLSYNFFPTRKCT